LRTLFAIAVLNGCERTPRSVLIDKEEEVLQLTDSDGDGYLSDEDCDDSNSTISPSMIELCDGVDNDCDGEVDEGVTDSFYSDIDGDGFGDPATLTESCESDGGLVQNGSDCDDGSSDVYPGAPEQCDGLDNDCDGESDEDLTGVWYGDADGDGYGSLAVREETCIAPEGYVAVAMDCDDSDGNVSPDALELCDGLDNDCDGLVDDADPDVDPGSAILYFEDLDGDGYGGAFLEESCSPPMEDAVSNGEDCDDSDPEVSPGAAEDCDLLDNDCDGLVDLEDPDVQGTMVWYLDTDRDGYGDDGQTLSSCEQPEDYVGQGGDCDDGDAWIHPAARETCDGLDEDCDSSVDEGALGTEETCPGASCYAILLDGSDGGDGLYWLDPDGDGSSPYEAWCDMTSDGGGWTRLFGSLYPTFWESISWQSHGDPTYDDYSMLTDRGYFADVGTYTFRIQIGESGNWDTDPVTHATIWEQGHDPFSMTTDGTDYLFLSGDLPATCGGFNGIHDRHHSEGGVYARATEQDSSDPDSCWWMQLIPLQQYGSTSIYPGYVDGYGGSGGVHVWQQLWVR
jgi:hypothetical protein